MRDSPPASRGKSRNLKNLLADLCTFDSNKFRRRLNVNMNSLLTLQMGPSLRPWSSRRKSRRRPSRTRSERCSANGGEADFKSFKRGRERLPHHKDRCRLADATIKPPAAPPPVSRSPFARVNFGPSEGLSMRFGTARFLK